MERSFATCVLCLWWLLCSVQKKLSAVRVLCFPGTEVTWTMNLICVFISACLAERRGLGLWSLLIAKPNTSWQLKFRKRKEGDSAQRNCLHSGADLLQVEIRVAHYFENLRNGEVERLRTHIPILCSVRQTYLVWFLCEEDFKDTEIEIHMVKTFCQRSCLWFISCISP